MDKLHYKTIAFIAARGGSKGIPGKNIKPLNGVPLIAYTLDAALGCDKIDLVVLTSDSDEIIKVARQYAMNYNPDGSRWLIIKRPDYLGQDHVQMGEVMVHAVRHLESLGISGDTAVILQPTSPFRTYTHLYDALGDWNGVSTLVGAYPVGGYYWSWDHIDGIMTPLGHNPSKRQGRQWDYQDHSIWKENGSLYVMPMENLSLWTDMRMRPFQLFEMDKDDSVDLDTREDWLEAERIMQESGWQRGLVNQHVS